MVRPEAPCENRQRAAKHWLSLAEAVCLEQQAREIVEAVRNIGVIRAQACFVDRYRTANERLGLAGAVRLFEQEREIAEVYRHIGMVRPVALFVDRERTLRRAGIGFRKHDNAFLAIADPAALQAAADRLSPDIVRRRLDYWTLILGPKFSKKERAQLNLSRLYAISQVEYCRNFIFKRHFPIHKLFERGCELGLWRLGADKIAAIFGTRLNRHMRGKLATVIDQIEHGHHAFRAYFKSAFLKQYEKFSTFLRNELVSNNLNDFGLRKGLDHLNAVRTTFQAITDRFAGFQAEWLNSHVDFPLLQRLAHPITVGAVRYPGLKIHEARVVRLFEVLLHGGPQVGGWTARQIHHAVLTTFDLSEKTYGLNQLRYDLRKLNGHGLIERDGSRYAYRLTQKGIQVALLFLFFHKRLCGPLANSRFHHQPDPQHRPNSRLEAAYHRADTAIQRVVDLVAAA